MTNNKLTDERLNWLHDAATELAATKLKMTMKPEDILRLTAELQEYRKAAESPAAWTDKIELEDMIIHGHAKLFKSRRAMGKPDPASVVKLYAAPPLQAVTVPAPDGYALVPIEPTEDMVIEGFESEPDCFFSKPDEWKAYEAMSGCQQAAHRARLCWAAMLAAAEKQREGK